MTAWTKGPVCVQGTCWAPAPTKKHSQDQTVPIQLLMAVIIFKEPTPFLAGIAWASLYRGLSVWRESCSQHLPQGWLVAVRTCHYHGGWMITPVGLSLMTGTPRAQKTEATPMSGS